jgi:hypothetical protein
MRRYLYVARYARHPPPHSRSLNIPSTVKKILKPVLKPETPEEESRDTTGETHEYTLSSDDQRTARDRESFDPKVTQPELEREAARKEHDVSHLDIALLF